jgi:Fur family transcriptional regulator, ferric uptake regulator
MSCINTLKEKGMRLTPQRRLIIDIIHDAQAHLTAEEIIERVQTKMPGVNKSTIYRTLELLEKARCVFRSESGEHPVYHHAAHGHHYHLVCVKCGKTIDCDEKLFLSMDKTVAAKYGFQVDLSHVVLNGLCDTCRKEAPKT